MATRQGFESGPRKDGLVEKRMIRWWQRGVVVVLVPLCAWGMLGVNYRLAGPAGTFLLLLSFPLTFLSLFLILVYFPPLFLLVANICLVVSPGVTGSILNGTEFCGDSEALVVIEAQPFFDVLYSGQLDCSRNTAIPWKPLPIRILLLGMRHDGIYRKNSELNMVPCRTNENFTTCYTRQMGSICNIVIPQCSRIDKARAFGG